MRTELLDLLTAYLEGRASRRDIGLWLAEFDWDSADPEAIALQDDVALLDLILMEVAEGLRPESELRDIAAQLATTRSEVFGVPLPIGGARRRLNAAHKSPE